MGYRMPETWEGRISTLGGLGFLTGMPGTIGSAAALLLAIIHPVPAWFIVAAAGLSVWASGGYARQVEREDPSEVIADEAVGMWLAIVGLPYGYWLPAFCLFRVIDIIKPIPVSTSERLPGGWGIVADDAVGGLLTNGIIRGASWLFFGGGLQVLLHMGGIGK